MSASAWRSSLTTRWRSCVCWLRRHPEDELLLSPWRLWLRCATCGRETPGWDLTGRPLPAARARSRWWTKFARTRVGA